MFCVKKSLGLFFLVAISLLMGSCGLDLYYVLEPVQDVTACDDTHDALNRYFSFVTNESPNENSGIFVGTSVFYKIYDSKTALTSDATSISNANTTEYSENGYTKMVSLGYKQMALSTNADPLVECEYIDRNVKIRLFTEGTYYAGVQVANVYVMDGEVNAIPLRSNGTTFDFFPNKDAEYTSKDGKYTKVGDKQYENATPSSASDDVKVTLSSTETWYVNAYVVSVGRTPTFTLKYSQIAPLGYIEIAKGNN